MDALKVVGVLKDCPQRLVSVLIAGLECRLAFSGRGVIGGSERLLRAGERLRGWMLEESLPLWIDVGMHPSGGVYEALDFDGRPVESDVSRVRVQARQVFSFALAHRQGFEPETTRRAVESLVDVLTGACRRPDGLYGRIVDLRARTLSDDTVELYDNAFAMLALASARGVASDDVDRHIDALFEALDTHLRHEDGGYTELLPPPSWRLQNPHMHLFESLLALYESSGDAAVRERIASLYDFVAGTFFNEEEACVHEFAGAVDDDRTGYFEPGHSVEWVWLLGRYARLLDRPYPDFGRALYARALESLDDAGRAMMGVAHSGEPVDASRRLWSQTETIKAHLTIMEHSDGDDAAHALERAVGAAQGMHDEWLAPAAPGGWLDHFDEHGRLRAKDMPASSGYHVYSAVAEILRLTRQE